ncbi:MAG TPA: tRNA pseudouridine(38-40) synthase TruA [Blastocatellia bacterium]|nr:tRNA pseudouridine(38-40) synthase TruA [Blastocatellia bacterium]
MQNVKITIQYDGTDFHGWQVQSSLRTVQGELTRVLALLDSRVVTVHGAGRTDAGVHAEGQVASFFLEREFEPRALRDAINGNLDRDVRVFDVEFADDSFNARSSAKLKTYRYHIWTGDVVSPFLRRYVHHHRGQVDVDAMRRAAAQLIGAHDFGAFTVATPEVKQTVRNLMRLDVEPRGESLLIIAAADGFLRYMVRTIVGTLMDVGRGRLSADHVSGLLATRDRADAGPTAPACGLTLVRVDY